MSSLAKKSKIAYEKNIGEDFLYSHSPHIEIDSNVFATVEGCKGIIEYTADTVRINCKDVTVRFTGENLEIENLVTDRINIKGIIISVEYLS